VGRGQLAQLLSSPDIPGVDAALPKALAWDAVFSALVAHALVAAPGRYGATGTA